MVARDEMVARLFVESGAPLAVLYGGGYNREVGHTARLHRNTIAVAKRVATAEGVV